MNPGGCLRHRVSVTAGVRDINRERRRSSLDGAGAPFSAVRFCAKGRNLQKLENPIDKYEVLWYTMIVNKKAAADL